MRSAWSATSAPEHCDANRTASANRDLSMSAMCRASRPNWSTPARTLATWSACVTIRDLRLVYGEDVAQARFQFGTVLNTVSFALPYQLRCKRRMPSRKSTIDNASPSRLDALYNNATSWVEINCGTTLKSRKNLSSSTLPVEPESRPSSNFVSRSFQIGVALARITERGRPPRGLGSAKSDDHVLHVRRKELNVSHQCFEHLHSRWVIQVGINPNCLAINVNSALFIVFLEEHEGLPELLLKTVHISPCFVVYVAKLVSRVSEQQIQYALNGRLVVVGFRINACARHAPENASFNALLDNRSGRILYALQTSMMTAIVGDRGSEWPRSLEQYRGRWVYGEDLKLFSARRP
ncbi:unnamed protein product (mitochondrion) [Plasmodiophora brassicae]|uniref:Uncharacterized protein n=1 Tax=Plasmodiophora brassicae TaxID=37360 RepID=A0A3P3YPA0_PLABS|nr:unnamed protein product [Plasmodiophora brassicae]